MLYLTLTEFSLFSGIQYLLFGSRIAIMRPNLGRKAAGSMQLYVFHLLRLLVLLPVQVMLYLGLEMMPYRGGGIIQRGQQIPSDVADFG